MISVASAAPRAAPRRRASCLAGSLLAGAARAWAASGVLKRSSWHPGLEYVVRVTPRQLPEATAEAQRHELSHAATLNSPAVRPSVDAAPHAGKGLPFPHSRLRGGVPWEGTLNCQSGEQIKQSVRKGSAW